MIDDLQWSYQLAVALAIGLLVGIERGWDRREAEEGQRTAGVRTFGLMGMLGGLAGLVGIEGGLIPASLMFVGVAGFLSVMYALDVRKHGDLGATTEIAALTTFVLATMAGLGHMVIASAAAVVMVVLLGAKSLLHDWLEQLRRPELVAAAKLLVISVVLLPLLPNQGYGPWQSLNPYVIWWMVVLVAGVSFVGYFAVRLAGARAGIAFTALFGGMASSTAVTLHLSRLAARGRANHRLLAGGILLACGIMFPRLLLVAVIINPALWSSLVVPVTVMSILVLGPAFWLVGRPDVEVNADNLLPTNPLELTSALVFGALLAAIMLLGKALTEWFGDAGVYALAAASGVADVDAINLSLAGMSRDDLALAVASLGILIAAAVNSLVKAGITVFSAKRSTSVPVAVVLVLAVLAGLGFAVIQAVSR
ncbi:MAG: MgtC/SapB family protein [Woeseia sp.]